ncbi:MAG: hypothetical protein M1819_001872 [Sarea resinae]|nr:MAG: hypothetical protein M1819_001872 [Sarea resinae]
MPPPSAIDVDVTVHGETDTSAVVLPDPLSLHNVAAHRAKSGPFHGGVAAASHSDLFKSPSSLRKPKAKRWDHRLNLESTSRTSTTLKGLARYLAKPGMISLGGGLPSSHYFPFEEIDLKVPAIGHFTEEETRESGKTLRLGKYDVAEGKGSFALNYGQGTGSAQMLRFVTEHTEIVHNPPYQDWSCAMTVGSTSGLDMAYRMFTNRGDFILSEKYTFATAIETAAPMGVRVVGIEMDEQGLLPADMDDVLSNWDAAARGAPKPWLLYTVPSGQNPTGATQGVERRKELYKVAQKHDVYIVEDEPYYFLQMQPYTGPDSPGVPPPASHEDFIKALVPSLLSLDTDGRVMRLDSFSKVVAPGSRVGWITASDQIVERFVRHSETSNQGPSGFSQVILHKLLDESWGHSGYLDWLMHIRVEYTHRRDVILKACEKYLPREVASWNPPMAGMFHWIRIAHTLHPHYPKKTILELEDELLHSSIDRGVLVAPGSWFRTDKESEPHELFFRATFAAAPADKMDEAIRRFGEALRVSFELV